MHRPSLVLSRTLAALLVAAGAACGGHGHGGAPGRAHGGAPGHGHGAPGHGHGGAAESPPHGHHHGGHGAHRFEDAEAWAPVFDDPARDAWQRPADVVELMRVEPGMTVADLGAGTGYFVVHLARAVGASGRVLALDVEPDMVRYLRARAAREGLPQVEARQVSGADPGLPPGAVDRVLVVNTWHHLPDRPAYARRLAAGLRPGGRVYVVDFTAETERGPARASRVKPEDVIAELRAGGLEAALVEEGLPDQYVVVGQRR